MITDDPNCFPDGKGVEGSEDDTIGYNTFFAWDQPGEGPGGSGPDFYVNITIANTSDQSSYWEDKSNVLDDWPLTVDVPDDEENVDITIELWEEDGASDMLCDISLTGKRCNVTYNLRNGTWWGDDHVLDTDFLGRTCGEVDGDGGYGPPDANVIFEIDQNDYDNDGITYRQELNIYGDEDPFHPDVTNDRFAVIVGGGASCKVKQTSNEGNDEEEPYKGPYLLYGKGSSWTDYTLEVDIMTKEFDVGDKEDIGVMFRYQDDDNYYILRWEQKGMRDRMYLHKIENNEISSDFNYEAPAYLERDNWYTLKIVLDGDNIQVWKNDNRNDDWDEIFNVNDDTFSDGSIALFCWKNRQAWFDDVLVTDSNGDVLLIEGFDYSIIPSCDWTSVDGSWEVTPWSTDQEELYKQLDFLYRELLLIFHYDDSDINYLSAHRWRDADGDSTFDVDKLSIRTNIKKALNTWLEYKSDGNDLNFVYIVTHGYYIPWKSSGAGDYSRSGFDSNRDGDLWNDTFHIKDKDIKRWLPSYDENGIGRLIFLIDSCFSGHYNDALGETGEQRIIMASSTQKEPAELETGQDWVAFSHRFFTEMADGETTVVDAFNNADKHVTETNFMTTWVLDKWEYTFWPQDARLDDNGNGKGSAYDLPRNGDWYDVYEGSYVNHIWATKRFNKPECNYEVEKARVRFLVRRGILGQYSADLHEFDFYDGNSWVSPTGYVDRWNLWDDEDKAFDENPGTYASCIRDDPTYPYGETYTEWFWTPYLELTLADSINCQKLRFNAKHSVLHCNKIDIDVYFSGYREGDLAASTGL